MAVGVLNAIDGIEYRSPEGAFYVFPGCHGLLGRRTPDGAPISSDADLTTYFQQQVGVALVPGSAFELPGHFRVSYTASDSDLAEAMNRIAGACALLH